MTERTLTLRVQQEGADEAARGVEAVGKSTVELKQGLSAVKPEAEAVFAAMQKLKETENNPRLIGRAALEAKVAVTQLKDAIAEAEKNGKTFGPDVAKAIGLSEQAIAKATKTAGAYRDAQRDLKKEGDILAAGFEALSKSGNSLEGVFSAMKVSGGESSKALGALGLQALALSGAFVAGLETGKKVDEFLKKQGIDLGEIGSKWILAAQGAEQYNQVQLRIARAPNIKALEDTKRVLAEIDTELGKAIAGWTKSADAQAYSAKTISLVRGEADIASRNIRDWTKFVKEHGDVLGQWIDKGLKEGRLRTDELTTAMKSAYKEWQSSEELIRRNSEKFKELTKAAGESALAIKKHAAEQIQAAEQSRDKVLATTDEKIKKLREEVKDDEERRKKQQEILDEEAKAQADYWEKTKKVKEEEEKKLGEVQEKYKDQGGTLKDLAESYGRAADKTKETTDHTESLSEQLEKLRDPAEKSATAVVALGGGMTKVAEASATAAPVLGQAKERIDAIATSLNAAAVAADRFAASMAGTQSGTPVTVPI